MSVLPGLWDMHVHLMINGHSDYTHWDKTYPARFEKEIMPASARQLLMAGVTSARDLGGPLEASINVRNAINRGDIPGADDLRLGTVHPARAVSRHRAVPLGRERRGRRAGKSEEARRSRRRRDQADRPGPDDEDEVTRGHRRGARRAVCPSSPTPTGPKRSAAAVRFGADNIEHTGLATAPEYPADVMDAIRERTRQDEPRPVLLDADGRGALQLRLHARQPRDARRSVLDARPAHRTSSTTSGSRFSIPSA